MSNRQINQMLWSVTLVSLLAGFGGALLLAIAPLGLPAVEVSDKPHIANQQISSPESSADVSLVGRTFRASAAVAPVTNAQSAAPTTDISAVQLVGTIGDSIAMLRGPDGTTAIVEVGDDVNGAAVLAIRPFQVDLKLNGRKTTLVKSDTSDSNASDPNAVAWPSQP